MATEGPVSGAGYSDEGPGRRRAGGRAGGGRDRDGDSGFGGVAARVGGGPPAASSAATAQIPPAMLTLYQQAAATCPGLPWTILAAIGTVESDNGQSNLPGVHSGANGRAPRGRCSSNRTFAAYDEPVPSRRGSPAEPVRSDGRRLCCGPPPVRRRGGRRGRPVGAVYAYNHRPSYVRRCWPWPGPTPASAPATTAETGSSDMRVPSRSRGRCRRSARPTSGAARRRASASTARAWCRPPTRWLACHSPGGAGPVRHHAEAGSGAVLAPGTWCSSEAGRMPSTTSALRRVW